MKLKLTILLALSALMLAGCGGGGGGENLPINNPGGGNGGGTSSGFDDLDPSIVVPAAESFVEYGTATDSNAQRWVKNLYNTIPAPGSVRNGPARPG